MSMTSSQVLNVQLFDQQPDTSANLNEILAGLKQPQKTLSPRFFYDTQGSELFEKITQTPEYYPTRTERRLLSDNADAIAQCCGERCVLIEPGSGSSEKVRLLLDTVRPDTYVPIDIAGEFLTDVTQALGEEFPWLDIKALCADFAHVDLAELALPQQQRVAFYPGSTIGNMTPEEAKTFLAQVADWVGPSDGLILGVDLHKDSDILNRAYNDAAGITEAFNKNALRNLNRLVGANFDVEKFQHQAFYNQELQRIEMHLVATEDHLVTIGGHVVTFRENETIHTENSYKYTIAGIEQLASAAGWALQHTWMDENQLFSLNYFVKVR